MNKPPFPYTIINVKNISYVYHELIKLGYRDIYSSFTNFKKFDGPVDIVIDDTGIFGRMCFYRPGGRNNRVKRQYVSDIEEFLFLASYYMHQKEF